MAKGVNSKKNIRSLMGKIRDLGDTRKRRRKEVRAFAEALQQAVRKSLEG